MQILFGGTRILQHTGADKDARIRTPDSGCLAVVLRTGFDTSQGAFLCTALRCGRFRLLMLFQSGLTVSWETLEACACRACVTIS